MATKKTTAKLVDNKKYPFTIKKGDKFKIINSAHGHSYGPIGTICTANISFTFDSKDCSIYALAKGKNSIYADQFILTVTNKQEIQKEIVELKKELVDKTKSIKEQIANLEIRLKFMNENKLDNFDETEFKAYKVLQLLKDKKLSDIERAKLIASLVNE